MSTASRVVKNTSWLYVKMVFTGIISLVTTRLILNSLGASDYGIYNAVGGAIAMLGFLNAAMASATQRFLNYSEGEGNISKLKSIFNVSLILHLGVALLMIVILSLAGFFFFGGILEIPSDRLFPSKIIYCCLVFSTAVTICSAPFDALLTSHENMKFYAYVGIIESVLKFSVAVVCVYTSFDKLIIYGLLMAFIPVASLLVMLIYCRKYYCECVFKPSRYFSLSCLGEIGGFAGWNLFGTSSMMLCNYGQGILINHFFGVLLNAATGIVSQLTGLTMVFTNNMTKAVTPTIVKKAGCGDDESMLQWSYNSCRFSFLLLAFIAIPLCFETEYILKLWLKNVPDWTVLFVQLQMMRTLLEQVTAGLNTTLAAHGNIREMNIQLAIIYLSAFVILAFLFKYGFPPYVLYLIMILAVLIQSVLKLLLCRRYVALSFRDFSSDVLIPIVILTVLMSISSFIPSLFLSVGLPRLILTFILCWSVMTFSLFLFFLHQSEKDTLLSYCKNILSRLM